MRERWAMRLGEVRIYRSTIQELNAAAQQQYSSVEPFCLHNPLVAGQCCQNVGAHLSRTRSAFFAERCKYGKIVAIIN